MTTDTRTDLSAGVALAQLADGAPFTGRVGDEQVILLRAEGTLFAVGAHCTHYSGSLADGLVAGDTIRCPLHHACFSLRTGEALRAPALDAIGCWRVEQIGDRAYVRERLAPPQPRAAGPARSPAAAPSTILILGGGAAGLAAADALRREGFDGALTIVSADADPPCDRPNLSKDYLAGTAEDDWIPLRPPPFYVERRIELLLGTRATALDLPARQVQLESGRRLAFDALLLATGAEPLRLSIPGASPSQVCLLRSYADSRAIVAKAASAKRVVIVGASFIGLEVAAALRTRGIEVHVVGREQVPMERVLGSEAGHFIQALHESHGVVFHLGATVERMEGSAAVLDNGVRIVADFIVAGVGVKPSLALAEQAGLALDRGVVVNAQLQTSVPGVFAAGDIARWPDPHSGERIRVEHWVVAQRQGQVAALNILGRHQAFDAVPFFWSQHHDVSIRMVGHAESWDTVAIDGSLAAHDCTLSYRRGGRTLAVATLSRDRRNLEAELAMELAHR